MHALQCKKVSCDGKAYSSEIQADVLFNEDDLAELITPYKSL